MNGASKKSVLCRSSLNQQKGENMRIDRSYLGNQNTYAENNPKCIVVHNTDNFAAGADARAHARAQHDGNFQNISAHYYVDDGDTAYQAAPHSRGCWHVGINYGGKNLFQQYGTRTASAWRCVCRPGIIMKKHLRTLRHWCGRSCGRRGFRWKESTVIMTSAANTVRARS